MSSYTKIRIYLFLALLMCTSSLAWSQRLWSNVSVNKSSVYVGQPVEVSIEVFTSTWFTSGIDPGNIQVEGAFTVYFRPVSKSIRVEGQTYSGVELIYQVFPYQNEDIIFPSLTLTVETPPDGDYKGVKKTLVSEEKVIRVKPIPADFTADQWLVATNFKINDQWSTNASEVMVGDVITRNITRTAYGTVAELIPPIVWDSVAGTSLYPSRSDVQNNKTKTSIYATRTETMRYLFTEEGSTTLPAKTMYWFHATSEKLYKRTLPEKTITVLPNPNLGLVKSIRDSLNAQVAAEVAAEEEKPFEILGLTPLQFAMVVAIAGILIWLSVRLGRKLIRLYHQRRQLYLQSEPHYFRQFKRAIKSGQTDSIYSALYHWIDQLPLKEPNVISLLEKVQMESLVNEWQRLEQARIENRERVQLKTDPWSSARQQFFSIKSSLVDQEWVNPLN